MKTNKSQTKQLHHDMAQAKQARSSERPEKSKLRENVEAIAVAIILALFIRTFVIQAFKIPSGSMKETLQIGDHILVNKFIYGIKIPFVQKTVVPVKDPKRGDIVVFEFPEDPKKDFIKRVVGIGGDKITIRDKKVYVNGDLQDCEFAVFKENRILDGNFSPRDNMDTITVPDDSLFVMGDNRDQSYDSRFWGFVNLKAVKGKAFMIYWSWDKEHFPGGVNWLTFWSWVRWNRIADLLH